MITGIIFSKNRPMQLELLLSSVLHNFVDLKDIKVLFTCDDEYLLSYQILMKEWTNVNFIKENSFSDDLSNLFDNALTYTVFFTDDSFIYRDINYTSNIIDDCFNDNDTACFSLRLGANIDSRFVMFLDTKEDDNSVLSIKYKDVYCHDYFGYPLSLDGHIFRTELIKFIANSTNSSFPNELEGRMAGEHREALPDKMYFFRKSALVINPVNRVQHVFTNKFGTKHFYDISYLNELFLQGYYIDRNFNDLNVNSCHQEIPFKFVKRD